jgi:hypothetical protein
MVARLWLYIYSRDSVWSHVYGRELSEILVCRFSINLIPVNTSVDIYSILAIAIMIAIIFTINLSI